MTWRRSVWNYRFLGLNELQLNVFITGHNNNKNNVPIVEVV